MKFQLLFAYYHMGCFCEIAFLDVGKSLEKHLGKGYLIKVASKQRSLKENQAAIVQCSAA